MTKKRKGNDRGPSVRNETAKPAPINRPAAAEVSEPESSGMLARTYLPESFLVMLLCLTPVALPAVFYGFAVRQASQAGDLEKANAASELARIWFILSVCFGVTANIALVAIYLVSQKT